MFKKSRLIVTKSYQRYTEKLLVFIMILGILCMPIHPIDTSVYAADEPTGGKTLNTITVNPKGTNGAITSINQAVLTAKAGTVVLVQDGEYEEGEIIIANSGSENSYITVKAEGKRAIIHANIKVNGSYIRIEGLIIDGENKDRGNKPLIHGIQVNAPNSQIVGNSVKNWFGYGIRCEVIGGKVMPNAYIAHNYVYNCMAGFQIGDNTILERNEVEKINIHNTNEPEGDFARVFGSNIIIRYNYLHGTTLADLYRPATPNDPAHADVFQSWDDAQIEIKNVLAENNVFLGFYHQGLMLENDKYGPTGKYYISDWTVRNNVFGGVGASAVWSGKVGGGTPNMVFENNTFTGTVTGGKQAFYGINMVGTGGSAIIRNNIFVGFQASTYGATDGSTIKADYNLIYNGNIPVKAGQHDILGLDPKFIKFNPIATDVGLLDNDWHLSPDSPAIDTGDKVSFKTDLEDNARPLSAGYDMGAYEFGGVKGKGALIVTITNITEGQVEKIGTRMMVNVDVRGSDNVDRVELYSGEEKLGEDTTAPYQLKYDVKKGPQTVKAIGYDKDGRETSTRDITIIGNNESYVYAEAKWLNTPLSELKGKFTVDYDVMPTREVINGVISMEQGEAQAYSKMSAVVRFNPTGAIDAYNLSGYSAVSKLPYKNGQIYHVKMQVDIPNKKYNVYVIPEGQGAVEIGTDYGFRVQTDVINNWAAFAEAGNMLVFGFKVRSLTANEEFEKILTVSDSAKKTIVLQINNPQMMVDGVQKEIDPGKGTSPVVKNDRTLIPIRALIEELGGTADWNDAEQKVTLKLGTSEVDMWIDKNKATVNGTEQELDVAPAIIGDRTMVPIRFASENLGCTIEWDETTQMITLIVK